MIQGAVRSATKQPLRWTSFSCSRPRQYSALPKLFEEGERVILRHLSADPKPRYINKPLKAGGVIEGHHGTISHDDIIGKPVSTIVHTHKGYQFTIHEPTLAEHVGLTAHLATPIYSDLAQSIVNLLDLHPEPSLGVEANQRQSRSLEIFECGTGHGALTLHLARAIHAANSLIGPPPSSNDDREAWEQYRASRGAVIHSLDNSEAHSRAAKATIRNFRHGLYFRSIDFHVGTPAKFFMHRKGAEPFLNHAILDMPGAEEEMVVVAPHVLIGGTVSIFAPSITQIVNAQQYVMQHGMPLFLEKVVELSPWSTGGREWQVNMVRSRKDIREAQKHQQEAPILADSVTERLGIHSSSLQDETATTDGYQGTPNKDLLPNDVLRVVCRPKAPSHQSTGGFLGLWRRIKSRTARNDVERTRGLRDSKNS